MARNKATDTLGVQLPDATIAVIVARARALGWTKSRYGAAIIEKWLADGAPPVSKPDELMRATVMETLAHNAREEAMTPAERAEQARREKESAVVTERLAEFYRQRKSGEPAELDPKTAAAVHARRERQRRKP